MKGCSLCCSVNNCESVNHNLMNCQRFKSPKAKIDKLNELRGCTKCGWINHNSANCRFSFKSKCNNCYKFHFSFLCSNPKSYNDGRSTGARINSSNDGNIETNTNIVEFNVMQTTMDCDVVIPTFTVSCTPKKGKKTKTRVMYNPASQTTFISEKLSKNINYKILNKNIKAKITGFN